MGLFGALGAIGGAIAGSLINSFSARSENSKNRSFSLQQMEKEAQLNKDYAKWSAKELPKLNREGMLKAGFNPILAINNGTGTQGSVSGSSPSTSVPQLDVGAISSALGNVTSASQKERALDNQERLQNATLANLTKQGQNIDALTLKYNAERAKIIRDTILPTNSSFYYDLKRLFKWGVRNGAFKTIGESFSGSPVNNTVHINNVNSASGSFRDAMRSIKHGDFSLSLPVNGVYMEQ